MTLVEVESTFISNTIYEKTEHERKLLIFQEILCIISDDPSVFSHNCIGTVQLALTSIKII